MANALVTFERVMLVAGQGQNPNRSERKSKWNEKAEATSVYPTFEKFGGGQNEQNRSEAWRGLT